MAREAFPFNTIDEDFEFDSQPIETTFGQVYGASRELNELDTALGAIRRLNKNLELRRRDAVRIDPKELNRQFPDLSVPFTEPMSMELAESIAEQQRKRSQLQGVINSGEDYSGLANLAGGFVAHATDPIELGIGVLAEVGLGVALGATTVGRTLFGFGAGRASLGQIFARGAAEGTIEGLITEPLVIAANEQDRQDYTSADAFQNIALQAFVGGGLRTGVEVTGRAVKYGRNKIFSNSVTEDSGLAEANLKDSVSRVANDKNINPQATTRAYVDQITRQNGDIDFANRTNRFTPLDDVEIGKRTFFTSVETSGRSRVIGDQYGDGVYITDSNIGANGVSANSFTQRAKEIVEVSVKENAKLLNLETVIPRELRDLFKEPLSKSFRDVDGALDNLNGVKIYDMIRRGISDGVISENAIDKINTSLNARGYDGIRHEARSIMDIEATPQNVAMIFNESAIERGQRFKPKPQEVYKQTKQETADQVNQFLSTRNDMDFDAESFRQFEDITRRQFDDPDVREIEAGEDALFENLDSMKELGLIDEAQIEPIRAMKQQHAEYDRFLKAAHFCVRGNG